MENLYVKEKRGLSKTMLVALLAAAVIVAAGIWVLSLQPSIEEQKAQYVEGALKLGSPEFESISKDIIIATDSDNTSESYTGLGTIMMNIPATVFNKSDKTITLLQVKIGVVDRQNKMIKEKDVIVVPGPQAATLPPNGRIKIAQTLDGFDPKADRAMPRWLVTAVKVE